ncbi:MAG: limonene hydroxylase [Planctomycetota bacterium]|nr:MAG: limonene hydroxylase [Planctomycetota bacterium]
MGLLRRFFGRDGGDGEPTVMPWDEGPSILEFIRSHVVPGEPGVSDDGYHLPDEERVNAGSPIRWAAGAMDGVATHHMGTGQDDRVVKATVKLVDAYARQPTALNKAAVYRHVIAEQVVSIIDPVIEALINARGLNHERLYELAHSFVTEATDREPVKFGIALLGLFQQPANAELFLTLGRHDEFTLFCAVALTNSSENPEEALWTLARNVTGWGRIHVVERLAQTTNPAIQRWLVREGFRNSVMDEYLAATCARAGKLRGELSQGDADRELLSAAGAILEALIAGGPAEGIDDYEDARPVMEMYLDYMTSSAESLGDFLHVASVRSFLGEGQSEWENRYSAGWTADCRDRLRAQCGAILGRAEWMERTQAQLGSADEVEFHNANRVAKQLGIDTWNIHWRRLQEQPLDVGRWYEVMAGCDESRIAQATQFAETNLDLQKIATGPGDAPGIGPGFEHHMCLDFVLQELGRFPGHGARLIAAGLQSPVVRNRGGALTALANWPRETWPGELETLLKDAVVHEPDDALRDRMRETLESADEPS